VKISLTAFKPASFFFKSIYALTIAAALAFSVHVYSFGQAQPRLPTVELSIGKAQLTTEIASTGNQRYMGLSFRQTLKENEAMLFVYPTEQALVFTMRNTLIPLSIAFISDQFVINEIHDMPVGPNQTFPSKLKAKYALEVNQGWFERNNIKAGDVIRMK